MATKRNSTQSIDDTINALEADARKKQTPAPHTPLYDDHGYRFRQRMVWSTVIFLGIGIFGMWGWHMKTIIYDASKGTLGKDTPFDTAGEQFNEAMKIAGAHEETDILPGTSSTQEHILIEETTTTTEQAATSTIDELITTLQTKATTSTSTTSETSPQ